MNRLMKSEQKASSELEEQEIKDLQRSYLEVVQKNEEFSKSLDRAEIIQKALLPKARHLERGFADHFAIHLQKEGVGGDFYWFAESGGRKYVAVADCTGHGVPGALLAMLGQSFLDYIVHGKGITECSEILKDLDRRLIGSFRSSDGTHFENDWIDIALCGFDPESMEVEFAGAQRTILHVKEGESLEHRGANYPVGGWQLEAERPFPSKRIPVDHGEAIYMGSDGFQDQFGGQKGKKFNRKRLHDLIIAHRERSMDVQKELLEASFKQWKSEREQIDDVCLLGIRF